MIVLLPLERNSDDVNPPLTSAVCTTPLMVMDICVESMTLPITEIKFSVVAAFGFGEAIKIVGDCVSRMTTRLSVV